MSLKQQTITMAAAVLLVGLGSASVSAQENCGFQYQRVMQAYQMQSPQYGQMLDDYTARCLSGSSAVRYQTPYTYQTPYAYQQPVDPGAAFLGGMVGGVVLGEALQGDHSHRYYNDHGGRGWEHPAAFGSAFRCSARRCLRDWPAQLVPAASLNGRLQQEKLVMGKDRIARTAKEAKGSVNEAAGKVVGDAKLQSDGKAERTAARSRMASQHEGHRAEDRQEVNRTVFLNEQPG